MKKLNVSLDFETFPLEHTCDGENISPKIVVEGLDESVRSLAVIIDDPDSPSGSFTHWAIWNIPPVDEIPGGIPNNPEVMSPIEAVQGSNSFGQIGYMGPCPPPGRPHRYSIRVYGLDAPLDIDPGAGRRNLEEAMRGQIVMQGEAMARYGR